MLKRFSLFLLVLLMFVSLIVVNGEENKYEINYGKDGKIEAILIEDFSTSVINPDYTWHEGKVEMKDGKVILTGSVIADAYAVGIPKANQDKKYREAKYLGLKITNKCDGDVYFCLQGRNTAETNIFMSPEAEEPYYLIDETGRTHDIVFSSSPSVYYRYGIMIPNGFNGYLLVPTNGIVFLNEWETPIWNENIDLAYIGVHASASMEADPFADATEINVEVDDLFMLTGELPAYNEPDPTQSPTPSPTPEATAEPTETPKPTATKKPGNTSSNKDKDISPLLFAIPAAVIIIAVIVVIVIKKRKA